MATPVSRVFRWSSWFLLVYCVLVIAWGALVRATGSGAGCGNHWPLCNGAVLPTLAQHKTMIEFTHRMMSGALGVLVVAWAIFAFRVGGKGSGLRKGALWAVALTVVEAILGALLVKLHLVEDNASVARAVGVGVHLINTFLLVGAIALTTARAGGGERMVLRGQGPVGKFTVGAVLLLLALGVTGAINALGDTLFPAKSLAEGLAQDRASGASFFVHLRAIHPILALCVTAFVVATAVASCFLRPSPSVRRRAGAVITFVCIQVMVGMVNFAMLAPVGLQMLHLAMANAVWISVVLWSAAALEEGAPRAQLVNASPFASPRA
jgi:cytochrome c oxidase assembly protein subunit 15